MKLNKKLLATSYLLSAAVVIFLFFQTPITTQAKDLTFPEPTNYVNDYANVISPAIETQLNEQLLQFETETSTQIFVVSVNDFQETYMEDYAVKLFEAWRIGQADKDNGLLLLFQPEGEAGSRVRIEVGYGLEGALTDAMAGRILDNDFMPYYFNNDFDTAVTESVNSLQKAVKGEYTADTNETDEEDSSFTIIIFVLFILASILGSTKSWWLGGVLGFIFGIIAGAIWFPWPGIILLPIPMTLVGLFIDLILSKTGMFKSTGRRGPWGGGFSSGGSSFGGGGFGGGGGGSSGGGGASR